MKKPEDMDELEKVVANRWLQWEAQYTGNFPEPPELPPTPEPHPNELAAQELGRI